MLLLAACSLSAGGWARAQTTTVLTDSGWVSGYAGNGYRAFLGIPYAAAPVGNLRWAPPQRRAPWNGIRSAVSAGSVCPQLDRGNIVSTDEDCLSVNVYAPTNGQGLPVMLWIHGGAFTIGSGSAYDGSLLAQRANVVVVTFNYRLGPLGFLAHPALTAETADRSSGQYGLMDQQFAMQWVRNNIAGFGGDPGNITVFGESAGGISVCMQMTSPRAAGLFHKAILQSGTCTLNSVALPQAEAYGTTYGNRIGCTTTECLRSTSVSTLLYTPASQQSPNGPAWSVAYGGVNSTLPTKPTAALSAGQFLRVPVINGSNHDEGRFFTALRELGQGSALTADQYVADVNAWMPSPQDVLAKYPLSAYSAPDVADATVFGDSSFICGARYSSRLMASRGAVVYAYEFNDPTAPSPFQDPYMPLLAAHTLDIQYVFPSASSSLNYEQTMLSNKMIAYWGNFARTSNPNGFGLPAWSRYSMWGDQVQSLSPGRIGPIDTFANDHKCDFWDARGY
jgi:para-nitrobenzyl esterase